MQDAPVITRIITTSRWLGPSKTPVLNGLIAIQVKIAGKTDGVK
jgi:hypothetical protein